MKLVAEAQLLQIEICFDYPEFRITRRFLQLAGEKDLKMQEALSSLNWPEWLKRRDLCIFFLKTSLGSFRMTEAGRLVSSSPRFMTWGSWYVPDREGKQWRIMSDGSIRAEWNDDGHYRRTTDPEYRVEMVTPKLTYDEMEKFQECVRRIRQAGGKVNDSCGMHVHVDASNHNRQSLKNLLSIMYSKEDLLFKALKTDPARVNRWCQRVREPMLQRARRLSNEPTTDLTQLENIWYEGCISAHEHYNWTRYYALNLHSVFYRGTIEWRCFNSTLHAGRAKAYVNLCLAMSAQAISQRTSVMRKTVSDNELFTFRVWLVRMGLNGDEFKNTRDHLLANLEGDRAWRYDKDCYASSHKNRTSQQEQER